MTPKQLKAWYERQEKAFWKRHDDRLNNKQPVDIIELVAIIRHYTGSTLKEAANLSRYLNTSGIVPVLLLKSKVGERQ